MADRIQQLVDDNKLLTSAVSHDLRTPLARLRFGVDTLSDTSNPKSTAMYLKRINNDLNEMESLVESLLRYARLDNVIEGVEKQNALSYANSLLVIEIGQDGKHIAINFSDDGPGIPVELRGRVVKPFERGSVSAETKAGFGLGLAVAARIAERHHGSLVIGESTQLGGALISVRLAHHASNNAAESVVA